MTKTFVNKAKAEKELERSSDYVYSQQYKSTVQLQKKKWGQKKKWNSSRRLCKSTLKALRQHKIWEKTLIIISTPMSTH
jgi:hypothetical protein